MARLSDIIEAFIKELISETEQSELEIQRNELANQFSCAPSQINYVLTTRFTIDKGYYIESRRGGGGCIKIKKIIYQEHKPLAQVINERIGNNITYNTALQLISGLLESGKISEREYNMMKIAVNDRTLAGILEDRNKVRADILKGMIMVAML
ncbi:MAG: CtsR family transcriptional regulator [Bacillota bacterium]|nr:CtsR family transcriptional regulator [Bacillota bacterium]